MVPTELAARPAVEKEGWHAPGRRVAQVRLLQTGDRVGALALCPRRLLADHVKARTGERADLVVHGAVELPAQELADESSAPQIYDDRRLRCRTAAELQVPAHEI